MMTHTRSAVVLLFTLGAAASELSAQSTNVAPYADPAMTTIRVSKRSAGPGLHVEDKLEAQFAIFPQDATKSYQWLRCRSVASCAPITAAIGAAYIIGPADENSRLMYRVTAVTKGGSITVDGPLSDVVNARSETPPKVLRPLQVTFSGTAKVGAVVGAASGQWDQAVDRIVLQWERCAGGNPNACQPIVGENRPSYTLTKADVGQGVRYILTAYAKTVTGSATSSVLTPILPGDK